jgi:carnitine 3-dehydrogenase
MSTPALAPVGIVGAGVIGAGWAARFLLHGHDVDVYEPSAPTRARVPEVIERAKRAYGSLGLDLPAAGVLRFTDTLADAVTAKALVQESVPEVLELKQQLLRDIDAHADARTIVATSTSGLLPTTLATALDRHPERLVVGHPFNPVYLLPLVEVVAGTQTSPDTVVRAQSIYASVRMKPLVVRKEIDAFIADRLLEAVWREALWLVHDGVASTAEIDDAITYGFGLRWAQMGLFETYRIAGGPAGMRAFMAQFGPALEWPWSKLTDVPPFTDELVDLVASQSDAQSGHRSIAELEDARDANLVGILAALRERGWGAGLMFTDRVPTSAP